MKKREKEFYSENIKQIFLKRLEKNYKFGHSFDMMVWDKLKDIWEQTNPKLGVFEFGAPQSTEDGKVSAPYIFHAFMTALGEVHNEFFEHQDKEINEVLDKFTRYLKYAVPELENLIECPFCKEFNPPDKTYCVHCQKEIISVEKNGKK